MTDAHDAPPGPPHGTSTETRREPPDDPAGPGHDAGDDVADHGPVDHAGAEEPLGPIDVPKWAAGVGGVAIAVFMAACFGFSTGLL